MTTQTQGERILSKVLPTGEILETIYNPKDRETFLAIGIDGGTKIDTEYTDSKGDKWLPYPPDDLITKGFVRLPSAVGQYETLSRLFWEIKDFIAEHMKVPSEFLDVATTYIFLTWVYDRFDTLPYLRIMGDFGTGKTRFQQVIGNLCYKSMSGSSMSQASIFRTIDLIQGTLVLDEADFRSTELWSEITKILNAGHTKDFPVVRMNVKKDGMTTQAFVVFGPKVLASRERFGDEALESRCLTQVLLPIKSKLPIHLPQDFHERATNLRNKLLAFRLANFYKVMADETTMKGIEFPRLQQSALALTSIASVIDDGLLSRILGFLGRYEKELMTARKHDVKADVLLCILDLIENKKDQLMPKIYMIDIANKFNGRFYEEYSDIADRVRETRDGIFKDRQKIISPKRIGGHVRKLGIKTERDQDGFFIQIPQETERVELLRERYGFEKPKPPAEQKIDDDIPFD